ncbi:MAG TPA: MIP/aquaporin family protein [Candidatus Sulfopaludibacter sp.]|jgi:glycerol uptake facilitator protein|nr:MIP/aquaporin family protein [Candidatus Sulfopaludibacter sp.]
MEKQMFGEFMGTMVLILLGNGVVANVLLRKSKAENAGWMVIATGWAFAVMCGVFTAIACGSSDAHLNPAVTIGSAFATGDFSKLLPYSLAQLAGAMCGATLVWLHYFPHWRETPDPDIKLACFSTGPAIRNRVSNLFSEFLGSFVLILVASCISSKLVAVNGPAPGVAPYLVGCLVWSIGLSLGGTTGYAINPARDLGPRVMHTILPIAKKGGSDWGYAMVPILGPLAGASVAGLFVKMMGI